MYLKFVNKEFFFGSVEIYCGLAFVYYCILRQLSTFIVHFYFLQVFLYVLFITEKNQKVPARGKPSRTLLCSGVVNNILQSKRVLKHTPLGR